MQYRRIEHLSSSNALNLCIIHKGSLRELLCQLTGELGNTWTLLSTHPVLVPVAFVQHIVGYWHSWVTFCLPGQNVPEIVGIHLEVVRKPFWNSFRLAANSCRQKDEVHERREQHWHSHQGSRGDQQINPSACRRNILLLHLGSLLSMLSGATTIPLWELRAAPVWLWMLNNRVSYMMHTQSQVICLAP